MFTTEFVTSNALSFFLAGSSSSRKAHKSKAEEEEEYDEAALHTPKKTPLKSPTHYRSDKKKKREYFTKEEVMVLVEHVHEKNGEPQWANLKKEHQDSSGLFGTWIPWSVASL